MRDSLYGLLCALLLGLGQLCLFTGFDTQSFIVEPVLHSVHDRNRDDIDAHAGYNGEALCMLVYTAANLAAPWVLGRLGSKMTLVIGSSLFTLYLVTFFYVHYIPYYLGSALMGIGFSWIDLLYYTGSSGYLTEHSTRETISRNSALVWAVGTSCMIVGGVVMLFTIQPPMEDLLSINSTNETLALSEHSYREYSDSEIKFLFGAFVIVSLCSNIIFALIPKRSVANSLAEKKKASTVVFSEELGKFFTALKDKRLLQMAPAYCLIGSSTCFWIAVYPTTFSFTMKLSQHVYLTAYYSIALGLGDMFMGFFITAVSKRIRNFAQMPSMILGCIFYLTAMTLVLLSTPAWSTNTPNNEPTLLIEPSIEISLVIALLFGMADNCFNTSRTVLCALVMPDHRAQVFSISKFYQSFTASILLFISPCMSIPMYFGLIFVNGTAALILYGKVAKATRRVERLANCVNKLSTDSQIQPFPVRKATDQSDLEIIIKNNKIYPKY